MSIDNRIAVLALVASDDSYQADWALDSELQTFPDSAVPEADPIPEHLLISANLSFTRKSESLYLVNGWKVAGKVTDQSTGFGAVIFQNDARNEALVAFTGTNGITAQGLQGWYTDLTLARTQWSSTNSTQVLNALDDLTGPDGVPGTFSGTIHFTGQSLGGALAQYALFDYADRLDSAFNPSRVSLTTFNGLGVLDRLSLDPRFDQLAATLGTVATAHFVTYNDIIHRLGGGSLNGGAQTYQLKFTRTVPAYEYYDIEGVLHQVPAREVAYDVVDTHRIEAGFYRGLSKTGWTFDNAVPYVPSLISAEASRSLAEGFGNLLNDRDHSPWESGFRIVSGITASVAINPGASRELARELLHAGALQAETDASAAMWRHLKQAVPWGLEFFEGNPVARSSLLGVATFALAVASALDTGEEIFETFDSLDDYLLDALLSARLHSPSGTADFTLAESLVDGSGTAKQTAKAAAALGFASRTLPDIPADVGEIIFADVNAGLESFKSGEWLVNFLRHVTATVAASKAASGATMDEVGRAAGETLGSVASSIGALESKLAGASGAAQAAFQDLLAEIEAGAIEVAQSLSNAYTELVAKYVDTFEWGAEVSRQMLTSAIEALASLVTSNTGGTGPSIATAINVLEATAQAVVVLSGRAANPFDSADFDPDTAPTSTGQLNEGSISTFTTYLAYAAPASGQLVRVKLSGDDLEGISVFADGEEVDLGVDGSFGLTVAEGQREVSFEVVALRDIDANRTVVVSATLVTLVDGQEVATHMEHEEATIALSYEAEVPPTGGREIRGDWAPKPYYDGEFVFYMLDDLGNYERLPGEPNTDGIGEPDNIMNGSEGPDHVVIGDFVWQGYGMGGDDAIAGSELRPIIASGGAGNDWIEGGGYQNHFSEYWERDLLGRIVKLGDDKLYGGAGDDYIYGDSEASVSDLYDENTTPTGLPGDWIAGGTGSDVIFGTAGDDVLMGGVGEDRMTGGAGRDVLLGDDDYFHRLEAGNFWTVVHPNFGGSSEGFSGFEFGLYPVVNILLSGSELIFPHTGDPYFTYYKNGGAADILIGGAGEDILIGQAGDDTLYGAADNDILAGWEGADLLYGGDGDDLMAGDFGRYEQVNQRGVDGFAGDFRLVRPGVLGSTSSYGTPVDQVGNDFLDGGAGNDVLYGEGGDDVLLGGEGNDVLWGDAAYLPQELHGADILDGGAGDDTLRGNWGNDRMTGGDGNDVLFGDGGDDVLEGGAGDDSLNGGEGDDTLKGGSGADVLAGDAGNDQLFGGLGDDQLSGGDGDDWLFGNEGSDNLDGGLGNDSLFGGSGEDVIDGGEGDDFIDGGAGIDIVRGGAGNDTYIVGLGYGRDLIEDSEGENRIQFGSGVLPDDVVAVLDSETLAASLDFSAAGDSIAFDAGEFDVAGIEFAGGVVWSRADYVNVMPAVLSVGTGAGDVLTGNGKLRNHLDGGAGDDSLTGAQYADTLMGGDGNDLLDGAGGSDRYVYAVSGAGIDSVSDGGLSALAYLDWFYAARGIANWAERGEYGGMYRAEGEYEGDGESGSFIEYFDTYEEAVDEFPSATITFIDPLPAVAPVVTRNDTESLAELVDAGVLDVDVVDFDPGVTLADLELAILVDAANVDLYPDQPWYEGGVLSVRWAEGGFDLEVPGVQYGFTGANLFADGELQDDDIGDGSWRGYRLGEGIELFRFADGSTYGLEEILQQAIVVLREGYLIRRNSGSQLIEGEWPGVDFEAGIDPSEVVAERVGTDLVFRLTDFSAEATVPGWYSDPDSIPPWEFRFADGTVFDTDAITRLGLTVVGTSGADFLEGDSEFASALYGLDDDDVLTGGAGNDLLDGGTWDDELSGSDGSDIYLYRRGDGYDTINDGGESLLAIDTLRLTGGITPDELEVTHDSENLYIFIENGVTLEEWFVDPNSRIERVEFDDGTVWTAAELESRATPEGEAIEGTEGDDVLVGTAGDDYLGAFGGNDTLQGLQGDDDLEGGEGDDTYLFDLGDGADEIFEEDGNDTLQFGAGIDPASVIVTRDPYAIVLLPGLQGDRVSIYGFSGDAYKVELVRFDDQTTWDVAELESRIVQAPATEFDDVLTSISGDGHIDGLGGDDYLYGLDGNDVLEGGEGEDLIDGGEGNNVLLGGGDADYLHSEEPGAELVAGGLGDDDVLSLNADGSIVGFNAGDGVDVAFFNSSPTFTLSVGGASASDIYLSTDGFDLYFEIGTEDSLALAAFAFWSPSVRPIGTLQVVGSDVSTYDLSAVMQEFLDAYALDPQIGSWSAAQSLGANLLSTSTTHAIGGAIAYEYATTGGVGGLSASQMHSVLGEAGFGFDPQPISLGSGNQAPVVDAPIEDQSTNEDAAFDFSVPTITFSDPDAGDELTYTATLDDGSALPAWLSFDAETQTFSGVPLQADVGMIEVKVSATDGSGLSADDTFTLTVQNVNDAPVVSAADAELLLNDAVLASALFSVFDEDGQSPTQYEFFDDVAGGGQLEVNGVEQGAGTAIAVSAADLANTEYVAGATPGTERVWVRAYDGEAWSAWKSWNMTSALHIPNAASEATPTAATQVVLLDTSVAAASLFAVMDADGDPAAEYQFWDSTAGNGHFSVNGVEQGVNVAITVSAADLANTQFVGSSIAGSDQVWVRATDGQTYGAWKSWTMNSWPHETNVAPVADAPDNAVLRNQSVLAQSLFSVTDADGDAPTQYEFWDNIAGGGYFALNGVEQTNNPIPVAAADLGTVTYVGGTDPGVEQVWVRVSDGLEWGAWESWNITTALHIPNAAPEATPTAATQTVLLGQTVAASTLFSVADADGDPAVRYEFFDSTAGNGHFAINGVEQAINTGIVVEAEDLADIEFVAASSASSDQVWVRATDGQTYGAWKSWTMNSWPHLTNAAPVATAEDATVLTGQVVSASSLFSVTDADGDAPVRYEFFDDVNGGGYWQVNGVQQAAATAIVVAAADLANAEYVGGANTGSERVWVRANDAMAWGAWGSWTMNSWPHLTNDAPVVTAANTTILLGQNVDASTLFSVTDADADAIVQYEFFDSTAGNGHFTVDGVEQGVNVAIGITAAQLADTDFMGSADTGSDSVWVRAHDGMAWSDWKNWTVNSWPHLTNAVPVITASNSGLLRDEALSAAMFFSVTDADADAPVSYEFWDDVNGGGYWSLEGVQQASGQAIPVTAAQLADLDYVGAANPGTEQVWVRASDGMGWSAWKNWLMATEGGMLRGGDGPDTLNGEAGPTVLQGGGGNDTLTDTDGDNLFSGGEGDDTMTGGDGDDLFAGGSGNDTINTGGGSNIIAYNSGGGIDTVYAAAGASNTLSFGGGIGYDDLALSKDGNDLIVSVGPDGQIVFKDWYAGSASVLNLQIIHDASDEFDANSSDPLYNKKVQTFDFAGLVAEFDDALAQSPGLTSWAVTNALLQFHLTGSDDAALGGDLAYWYGKNNGFTGISLQAAQQVLGAADFGSDAQTLRPFNGLQEGYVKLT